MVKITKEQLENFIRETWPDNEKLQDEDYNENTMKLTKSKLREMIREELLNEYTTVNWSSPEAKTQVNNDLRSMSKLLGKASHGVIKIMMNGVKDGKYDAMDLIRGIKQGKIRDTSKGVREMLQVLWSKVEKRFRKYLGGKKRR